MRFCCSWACFLREMLYNDLHRNKSRPGQVRSHTMKTIQDYCEANIRKAGVWASTASNHISGCPMQIILHDMTPVELSMIRLYVSPETHKLEVVNAYQGIDGWAAMRPEIRAAINALYKVFNSKASKAQEHKYQSAKAIVSACLPKLFKSGIKISSFKEGMIAGLPVMLVEYPNRKGEYCIIDCNGSIRGSFLSYDDEACADYDYKISLALD